MTSGNSKTNRIILSAIATAMVLHLTGAAHAEQLTAQAVVSSADVFVGESFQLQIQVSGSENPEKPDMSHINGFAIRELGGQQNSSRSVTIINGRMNEVAHRGYIFNYQLTPARVGKLLIPSITVYADGQRISTKPLSIEAKKPVETENFKLRMKLSKKECFIGEPVILTFTWYLGQDVRGFEFTLPVLKNKSFHLEDPEIDVSSGKQFLRIPIGGKEIIGEKSSARLEGKEFATINFKKVLIPKRAGLLRIKPAIVAGEALVGSKRSRMGSLFGDSFFDSFFDDNFFGRARTGLYKKIVVPSNELTLQVSELPLEGRPDNFAGHIGEYKIDAAASPGEVSVGDPITLTITLRGTEYLEHVFLPPLNEQPALARDFKIPMEMAAGKVDGRKKVFTQTIRALHPEIKNIPPIELPYFDTSMGRYRIARTKPISLKVKLAKIITALDAEGRELPTAAMRELQAWTGGISYNYEDISVLRDQRYGPNTWLMSRVWLSIIAIPPGAYLILLFSAILNRRRNADPLATRSRKAYGQFTKEIKRVKSKSSEQVYEPLLSAMRKYLGNKLSIPAGALTFNDAQRCLQKKGVNSGTMDELCDFFRQCEAGHYAENAENIDSANLIRRTSILAKKLDREL